MSKRTTPDGEFTGKEGNTVSYLLKGKKVRRTIGANDGPRSARQLAIYQLTRDINLFLQPVKEFLRIGFELANKGSNMSTTNMAYSHIFNNAIKGEYPDREIDFTKVLLSKGKMKETPGQQVKAVESGLEFSWSPQLLGNMSWDDTVMLVAYMPALNDSQYLLSGGRRNGGTEILNLTGIPDETLIHTYVSFISANRKIISDSVYTGSIIWNKK